LEVCLQINTSKKAVKYENGELVAIPSWNCIFATDNHG
jgi:hypothetical protein